MSEGKDEAMIFGHSDTGQVTNITSSHQVTTKVEMQTSETEKTEKYQESQAIGNVYYVMGLQHN